MAENDSRMYETSQEVNLDKELIKNEVFYTALLYTMYAVILALCIINGILAFKSKF